MPNEYPGNCGGTPPVNDRATVTEPHIPTGVGKPYRREQQAALYAGMKETGIELETY
jgi:hypothetical protein